MPEEWIPFTSEVLALGRGGVLEGKLLRGATLCTHHSNDFSSFQSYIEAMNVLVYPLHFVVFCPYFGIKY
jgi:hypothetical protein